MDESKRKAILIDYKNGWPLSMIKERNHSCYATIIKVVDESGIQRRNNMRHISICQMKEMAAAGIPITEIARQAHTTNSMVAKLINYKYEEAGNENNS